MTKALEGLDSLDDVTGAVLFDRYTARLNEMAVKGTSIHLAIEVWLKTGKRLPDLPRGWDAFVKKYDPDPVIIEHRMYDTTLMLTGAFDLLAYITIKKKRVLALIDWKGTKRKPNETTKMQVAIYAKNARWDNETPSHAMVVCFGAENTQGFTTATIDREKIENYYLGAKHISKAMDVTSLWITQKKYYRGELERGEQ